MSTPSALVTSVRFTRPPARLHVLDHSDSRVSGRQVTGARIRDLLDGRIVFDAEVVGASQREHDAALVQYHAQVFAR